MCIKLKAKSHIYLISLTELRSLLRARMRYVLYVQMKDKGDDKKPTSITAMGIYILWNTSTVIIYVKTRL